MSELQASLLSGLLADKHKEMVETELYRPFCLLTGIDIKEISCRSNMELFWECPKCRNTYRMFPKERVLRQYRNQETCFFCRGRRKLHSHTV